jgi:hypothetical protein
VAAPPASPTTIPPTEVSPSVQAGEAITVLPA